MTDTLSDTTRDTIGGKKALRPGLYIVATPIGNLGDVSERMRHTLTGVDVIACEDTRVTAKLLSHLAINKQMVAYHEHSSSAVRHDLIEKLKAGGKVALVSDAGTPLISDPGYRLVADAQDEGITVCAVPGPSAVTTALSIAGLPTDRFLFMGFAPNKSGQRQNWFAAEKKSAATLVYYESTRRLPESLADALSALGERRAAVCRELTKKFEEVRQDNLSSLVEHYKQEGAPKGEAVVIIAPEKDAEQSGGIDTDSDALLEKALGYMSVKDAAKFVSDVTGEKKKALYNKALELSGKS